MRSISVCLKPLKSTLIPRIATFTNRHPSLFFRDMEFTLASKFFFPLFCQG
jgi:hypothetical protein